MSTNDRNDHSPSDPQFRWGGPDVRLSSRPSPEQLDAQRRTAQAHNANLTGAVETATLAPADEKAVINGIVFATGIRELRPIVEKLFTLAAKVRELETELLESRAKYLILDHAHQDVVARLVKLENRKQGERSCQ
jgi:hypothetical protein